jgi:hypothetical protein
MNSETIEEAAASLVSLHDTLRDSCCTRVMEYCIWYINTSIIYGRKWFAVGKEFLLSMNPAREKYKSGNAIRSVPLSEA